MGVSFTPILLESRNQCSAKTYYTLTAVFFLFQLCLNSKAVWSIYSPWSNWCRDPGWEKAAWKDVKNTKVGLNTLQCKKRKKHNPKKAYFKSLTE